MRCNSTLRLACVRALSGLVAVTSNLVARPAAVGGTITYFAGGECVPIDLTNRELLLSILSIFASPPPTLCLTCALRRSGGTASAVVDYIDWSVQPATVLQLRQMNLPRKEAAAAYTAGNLVVGGG